MSLLPQKFARPVQFNGGVTINGESFDPVNLGFTVPLRKFGGGPEKTEAENNAALAAYNLHVATFYPNGAGLWLEPGVTKTNMPFIMRQAIHIMGFAAYGRVVAQNEWDELGNAPGTVLLWTGDGSPYAVVQTREKYRAQASDPKDAPLSPCIIMHASGCQISNVCIAIDGDATGWSNNVAIMTRQDCILADSSFIGPATDVNVLIDATALRTSTGVAPFEDWDGNPYPDHLDAGADGCQLINCKAGGGAMGGFDIRGSAPAPGLALYGYRYKQRLGIDVGTVAAGATLTLGELTFTEGVDFVVGATPFITAQNLLDILVLRAEENLEAGTNPYFCSGAYYFDQVAIDIYCVNRYQLENPSDTTFVTNFTASTSGGSGFTLSGATPTVQDDPAPYYDETLNEGAGGTTQDLRGVTGASDILALNCKFFSPHPPTTAARGDHDWLLETCPHVVKVSGLAGNGSGMIQGIRFQDCRFHGAQPLYFVAGYVNRLYIDRPMFDPNGLTGFRYPYVVTIPGVTKALKVSGSGGSFAPYVDGTEWAYATDNGSEWLSPPTGSSFVAGRWMARGGVRAGAGLYGLTGSYWQSGDLGYEVRRFDGVRMWRLLGTGEGSSNPTLTFYTRITDDNTSAAPFASVGYSRGSLRTTFAGNVGSGGVKLQSTTGDASVDGLAAVRLQIASATRFLLSATTTSLYGAVLPDTDAANALGSPAKRWTEMHASKHFLAPAIFKSYGTGSPEGVVTAAPGSEYIQSDGVLGKLRWWKREGTGNTGWVPDAVNGVIVGMGAVAVSHTGDTAVATLKTVTIPAGLMGLNGRVEMWGVFTHTNGADDKILRIRFGGASVSLITATTTGTNQIWGTVTNRGAANSQLTTHGQTSSSSGAQAIDTTAAVDIIYTAQLENAADTVTLEGWKVVAFYGA